MGLQHSKTFDEKYLSYLGKYLVSWGDPTIPGADQVRLPLQKIKTMWSWVLAQGRIRATRTLATIFTDQIAVTYMLLTMQNCKGYKGGNGRQDTD